MNIKKKNEVLVSMQLFKNDKMAKAFSSNPPVILKTSTIAQPQSRTASILNTYVDLRAPSVVFAMKSHFRTIDRFTEKF